MKGFVVGAVVVVIATGAVWYFNARTMDPGRAAPPSMAPPPVQADERPTVSREPAAPLVPPAAGALGSTNATVERGNVPVEFDNAGLVPEAPTPTAPLEVNIEPNIVRPTGPPVVVPSEPESLGPAVDITRAGVAVPEAPTVAPPQGPQTNTELAAVQRVVARYEQIYRQLDANAATSIWPSVDTRGLARAFARVQRQDLRFEQCAFALVESRATATCVGALTYVPRVGSTAPRTEQHAWSIDLERAGGQWHIVDVKAR